jgi:1-acyl-sn-glycerol-3-phosphate acyltransferase
LYIFTAGLWT